jgi:hypothetical protein
LWCARDLACLREIIGSPTEMQTARMSHESTTSCGLPNKRMQWRKTPARVKGTISCERLHVIARWLTVGSSYCARNNRRAGASTPDASPTRARRRHSGKGAPQIVRLSWFLEAGERRMGGRQSLPSPARKGPSRRDFSADLCRGGPSVK